MIVGASFVLLIAALVALYRPRVARTGTQRLARAWFVVLVPLLGAIALPAESRCAARHPARSSGA